MNDSPPSGAERRKRSSGIAERIRSLILAGAYMPGQYLRHDDLAREARVSATPVREALVGLSTEGFVRHEARRGFVVSPLKRRDLEDMYALLAQISARLAERAATAMPDTQVEELERVQEEMVAAAQAGDYGRVERLNDSFHRIINRAADSSKLSWILLVILKYVPKRDYAEIAGMADMLTQQHEQILECIRRRNAAGAYVAMYEHNSQSMMQILANLDRRGMFS